MAIHFEYGVARIRDIVVGTTDDRTGKPNVGEVLLDGRPVATTQRFWTSLHLRFGFTSNIFRYFRPSEVFERISQVAGNDQLRWCLETHSDGTSRLQAVTNPTAGLITYDDLLGLLDKHGAQGVGYHDGIVSSDHAPRLNPTFEVGGDGFQNKYVVEVPIDGFGRPAVYLSLLRLVCANGAIGYSPAFRSELSVGKGADGVAFALTRVLDGFNNEDGYAALRQRFEQGTRSWASVAEARRLYRVLAQMHHRGEVTSGAAIPARGGDGADTLEGTPLFASFHRLTGDLSAIYGLANLDALSVKRQRTLPAGCKVYDLLNFASEVATHHANERGHRAMQAYLGDLVSGEFDLEGTVDQFGDWRDFFIGNEATTETLAGMHRCSKDV